MSILIKDMEMPERCLKCPFYDNYNYCCILYSFGIPARYNLDGSTRPEWCELKNLPSAQQHWIRLEERLPDEDGWYLVTKILKRKPLITTVTVEYWGYGWDCDYDEEDDCVRGFLDEDHDVIDIDNFVAWMPLPEPCNIATSKEGE